MFFVIPEMSSKTFVMVLKKLPDHFKVRQEDKDEELLKFIEAMQPEDKVML